MLQKLVGFSPTTPSMKHSPNAISHPEWPLQLTFIQLPFSLENPKPNIQCRTNTYTDTVIPSFLSAVCLWMHFPLMSASCRRTASKLYYTPSHWCRRLSVLFFPALFVLLFGITASVSCTWTHHRGAILLHLRVGTFMKKEAFGRAA